MHCAGTKCASRSECTSIVCFYVPPEACLTHYSYRCLGGGERDIVNSLRPAREGGGMVKEQSVTIYAPMIYTAPCVRYFKRAETLRGQVGGGWALEISSFLGLVKWHRTDRRVPFGGRTISKLTISQQKTGTKKTTCAVLSSTTLSEANPKTLTGRLKSTLV